MNKTTMNAGSMNCLLSIAWLIVVLPFAVPVAAQAQSANDRGQPDWSNVRKVIQEQMVARATPSIAVAVARDGKILWEAGFGWADRENRIPATEHTMYYTASITKTFTETALLLLQERKQLDLDRPVNDYLGAAKLSSPAWNPAEATVRRVATHTAGLTTFNPIRPLSMEEMIGRYGVLFWPPGERFDYSNLGAIVLQEVVARVSGQSFGAFLRHEIFWPLGMTHASLGIGRGLERYAARRYNSKDGLQPDREGGVYCSAHDLALFGIFHLKAHLPEQKAILSDTSIDTMQNSTVATSFGKYGFAWSIEEDRYGYRSVLAQGGTDADQAWLRLIPAEGIAVVALSNIGNAPTSQIVDEILSTLLPTYGEQRAKAIAAPRNAPRNAEEQPPAQTFVGKWAGIVRTYRGDIPLTFSVQPSGDVHAKLGSQLGTLLNDVRFRPQQLSGRMAGDLGVDDAGATPYNLHFYLYLRDGALKGAVVTEPSPGLPFWTELKKVAEATSDHKQ